MAVGDYKNKRVLITGADGFMGSHLTDRLVEAGAHVSVFVRGSSVNGTSQFRLKNISHLQDRLKSIIAGNLASTDAKDLVIATKPEIVFHLAADAYVPYSFDHPLEVMQSNLIGTLNMLQALRECPEIKRLVATSSSEIYGLTQGPSIDEEHPLYPSSPYAASKVAADRYCYAYWNTYKVPVAIIRPFNTYGPRHTYDVIPKFIDLALKGSPLTVHGAGTQSRDFTYVDDMVDAFLVMGSHEAAVGKAVNFGSGTAVSIAAIAALVKGLSDSSSPIVHIEERQSEVPKLLCNHGLAERLFGWRPRIGIEEGLKRNIAWARTNSGA